MSDINNIDMVILCVALVWTVLNIALLWYVKREHDATKRAYEMINDLVDTRIWAIPIEVTCQYCKKKNEIDFSLNTTEYECKNCKKSNGLYIQFLSTVKD